MFVKAQLGSLLKCHIIVYVHQTGEKPAVWWLPADEHPRIFNYPADLREM